MTEPTGAPDLSDKRLKLRYAGVCRLCGTGLPTRADAIYERATKTVRCVESPTDAREVVVGPAVEAPAPEPTPEDAEVAGSSARREYERRKAKDEERRRQKWGKLGGLAVALSDEKQSTKAWATGAVGEERLGARLDSLVSESIAVLHDRRIRTKANIDHIAITAAGIWVIDAKKYKGRPELKIEGGILPPRVERVLVGRRDCTSRPEVVADGLECPARWDHDAEGRAGPRHEVHREDRSGEQHSGKRNIGRAMQGCWSGTRNPV